MSYKIDDWELLNIPEEQIEQKQQDKYFSTTGLYTCKIVDAKYYDEYSAPKKTDIDTYKITLECIEEGPEMGSRALLTYFVKNDNRTMFNRYTLGTMKSLGNALFSEEFKGSILAPKNIVGGVVVAEIKMKPGKDGTVWPKVYHYQSASKDFKEYSDIEQYWRVVKPPAAEDVCMDEDIPEECE